MTAQSPAAPPGAAAKEPRGEAEWSRIMADPPAPNPAPAPYVLAWLAVLFVISQVPLFAARHVGIQDFANHLARLEVYANLERNPVLQQYYAREFAFAPNLAMDVVVPLLMPLFPPELSLRLFVSLATLLMVSGCAALNRALTGRVGYGALVGLLFAGSFALQAGLFNFVFGLGVALWTLASWTCLQPQRRAWQVACFSAAATVIYACHLSAFGAYVLALIGFEWLGARVHSRRSWRVAIGSSVALAAQVVPAIVLHLAAYQPTLSRYIDVGSASLLQWLAFKLVLAARGLSAVFSPYPTAGALLSAGAVTVAAYGVHNGWIRLSPRARAPVALLASATMLLPPTGFGSGLLDARMLLPLVLVAASGLIVRPRGGRDAAILLTLLVAGTLLVAVDAYRHWNAESASVERLRDALSDLPRGVRVAVVAAEPDTALPVHAAAWSVIDRDALLPILYARPFNPFWVAFKQEHVPLVEAARDDGRREVTPTVTWLADRFDCVILFGSPTATATGQGDTATIVSTRDFRIVRAGTARSPAAPLTPASSASGR